MPAAVAVAPTTPRPADATSVYWTNQGFGEVMKLPLGGVVPVTLASKQIQPHNIAVGATSVFSTSRMGGTVMMVAKSP